MDQPIQYGRYILIDKISTGGMAEVFKAMTLSDSGFKKVLAIKRLLPSVTEDEGFIEMFVDEANIAGRLHHSNIVQTYDLGRVNDTYFMAMEYVEGRDLRAIFDRLKRLRKPIPVDMAAFIISKVCEGLDYAYHKKDDSDKILKVIHRDISPPNLLISYEGEVKLVDFGIAKAAKKITKTQAGILKGKFGYMSPEQVRGMNLTGASDIFSASTVLWEMLAGRRLFVGESDYATLEKVRGMEIPPPSTYNVNVPEELDRIVMQGLERDLEKRYERAGDMGTELTRYLYTKDQVFTQNDLMGWMHETFAQEIAEAKSKMEEILNTDWMEFGIDLNQAEASNYISLKQNLDNIPDTYQGQVPQADSAGQMAPPNASGAFTQAYQGGVTQTTAGMDPYLPPQQSFIKEYLLGGLMILAVVLAGVFLLSQSEKNVVQMETTGSVGTAIFVANVPEAEVVFDDRTICFTPCKIPDFPIGKHQLTFRKSGLLDDVKTVDMQIGGRLTVAGELYHPDKVKGVLIVVTEPPGARVLLEHVDYGQTPLKIKDIKCSEAKTLKIVMEGFHDIIEPITLGKEEFRLIRKELQPASPTVSIKTVPPGAKVYLDGKDQFKQSPTQLMQLEVGREYEIRLEMDGYETATTKVKAIAAAVQPVNIRLKAKDDGRKKERSSSSSSNRRSSSSSSSSRSSSSGKGWLKVQTDPPTKVYIDGKFSGFKTPARIQVPSGSHKVKLINVNQDVHYVTTVTIQKDKTSSIRKNFDVE